MFFKSVSAVAVLSLSIVAGCSSETQPSTSSDSALETMETEATLDFQAGSFKLYNDPETVPSPDCDVHTRLVLGQKGGHAVATLREVVGGYCEIHVDPNEREFTVEYSMNRCGSITFSGETMRSGEKRHISITDHRQRLCYDMQPSVIVVDEYDMLGNVTTRFSGR